MNVAQTRTNIEKNSDDTEYDLSLSIKVFMIIFRVREKQPKLNWFRLFSQRDDEMKQTVNEKELSFVHGNLCVFCTIHQFCVMLHS